MSRERTPLLELELERQNHLFQAACESLTALGDEARLSIPEHVLEELDAAFSAPVMTATTAPSSHTRFRA